MRLILAVLIIAFAAVTAATQFGRAHWLLDLAVNFRPQLAAAGLALTVAALALRRRTMAAAGAAALALNLAPLAPYLTPLVPRATAEGAGFRVLTLNLHEGQADEAAVVRMVEEGQVDIALLTELAPTHGPLLTALGARLPYRSVERLGTPFEVALLSRWPLSDVRWDRSVSPALPLVEATACGIGAPMAPRCVAIIGLHAVAPLVGRAEPRRAQLDLAARRARAVEHDRVILLGDLNLTPWSPHFADLLARAGLRDSGRGRGLVATWRSRSPLLGLPIDHVLVGSGLEVRGRHVGAEFGSDHFPLFADLALR